MVQEAPGTYTRTKINSLRPNGGEENGGERMDTTYFDRYSQRAYMFEISECRNGRNGGDGNGRRYHMRGTKSDVGSARNKQP